MGKKVKNYDPKRISADDMGFPTRVFEVENAGIGPATLYLSESDVGGKDATEIENMVERVQSAFKRSKHIAKALEEEYSDEKAIVLAHDFFKTVYHIVVMNCLHVYVARTREETDEARAESARLGQLERDLNGQWVLSFVEEVAEKLWNVWLTRNGPKSTADFGRNLQSLLFRHFVTEAILTAEAELLQEVLAENWDDFVWQTLLGYDTKAILDFFYKSDIYREAEDLLENALKPTEMSFEELRLWAGISFVEDSIANARSENAEPVRPDGLLNFPVDHAAFSLTQYLAGRLEAGGTVGNLMKVPVKAPRGQQRELAVAETLPPELLSLVAAEGVQPTLARIRADRNETKAKVFVGVLALASQRGVNPERFFVSLDDLVRLVTGYRRSGKNKTKSTYYWSIAAEIIRYLILDLASTTVHVTVKLPQYREPLRVEEWLMHRPRPAAQQMLFYSRFTSEVISLVNQNAPAKLVDYVKSVELDGFFLGFPKEILDALGARTGDGKPNALKRVSREVLKLKGSAFWLAYEIAFLRRWAKPKHVTAEKSKSLLEGLEKHGYCDKSTVTTGGRVSYKSALRAWFKDVRTLIDINMLEDPGISIHKLEKGHWHDVTRRVKGWLTDRGVRITREDVAELQVIYHLPHGR